MSGGATVWRAGGCHCGAVRFEAELPAKVEARTCTCSTTRATGVVARGSAT